MVNICWVCGGTKKAYIFNGIRNLRIILSSLVATLCQIFSTLIVKRKNKISVRVNTNIYLKKFCSPIRWFISTVHWSPGWGRGIKAAPGRGLCPRAPLAVPFVPARLSLLFLWGALGASPSPSLVPLLTWEMARVHALSKY